jgi:Tol biopolymer transport system component
MRLRAIVMMAASGAVLMGSALPVSAHKSTPSHHPRTQVITYTIEPEETAPSVALMRPDGSGQVGIPLPVPGAFGSRISPDGTLVVAATFADVGPVRPSVSRLDGSDFHRLVVASLPSDADVGPCTWATNRWLLCEVRSDQGVVDGIYRVDSRDRCAPQRLTVTPYPPGDDFGGGDIPGDVSPDGRRFVFVRSIPFPPPDNPDASQSGALFIGNLNGARAHRITRWGLPNSHDTGFESWGSHGRPIVFGTETGEIATIRPTGRNLRRPDLDIPANSYAYGPTWAPFGVQVAFGLFPAPDYQSDIYVANLHTGHLRQLTDTPNVDDAPDWGFARPHS